MPMTFTRRGAVRAALDVLPLTVAALLFGMVFGLLSAKAGLSVIEVKLMSGLVSLSPASSLLCRSVPMTLAARSAA